jgi:pectinesterase
MQYLMMENKLRKNCLLWIILLLPLLVGAQVIVDPNGRGDYKTIQEAINSLPDSADADRTILIRNGIYNEQVRLAKHHVVLKGENREKSIITGAIADVLYRSGHNGDKNSGVLNLDANDITIQDLTITNTYGATYRAPVNMDYVDPETKHVVRRTVRQADHQFALRSFSSTRLKVINCTIKAWGADTVSPWNSKNGMYYFKDCQLVGGTDFYCPRGWAYAENCIFITLSPSAAAIWHDGHENENMKSVLVNCNFKGSSPYLLARYHHDSQFYLINCTFDKNLADRPVFMAASAKGVKLGTRAYFYNCRKDGGNYGWLQNNLATAKGAPGPEMVTVKWAYDGQWDPVK